MSTHRGEVYFDVFGNFRNNPELFSHQNSRRLFAAPERIILLQGEGTSDKQVALGVGSMEVHAVLQSVLYCSQPTVIPWPMLILDIDGAVSRNHGPGEITGVLVFSSFWVVQYLEGRPELLAPRFDAIRVDRRHRVIWNRTRPIMTRALPGMPMGYIDAERERDFLAAFCRNGIAGPKEERADELESCILAAAQSKYPGATMA